MFPGSYTQTGVKMVTEHEQLPTSHGIFSLFIEFD